MFEEQTPAASLAREAIQNADDAKMSSSEVLRMRFAYKSGLDLSRIADSRYMAHLRACERLVQPSQPYDKILYVEDFGTKGLTGSMREQDSPMYGLLGKLGGSDKRGGEGGSFGYGKGACILNSGLYMVIAYTVTDEGSALFGTAYLDAHKLDGDEYVGIGWLQANGSTGGWPEEFRDQEADDIARALKVPRALDLTPEKGTSLVIPCPIHSPEDLRRAIAYNWWPKILRQELKIEFLDDDRKFLVRPSLYPDLRDYIELYDNMVRGQASPGDQIRELVGPQKRALGKLGLRVSEGDFGDQSGEADFKHGIALMRKPRMIVQYHHWTRGPMPGVIGVFEANPEINHDLQMTENHLHSEWSKKAHRATEEQRSLASLVLQRIHQEHNKLMNSYQPPPEQDSAVLSEMKRFFGALIGGRGQTGGGNRADPITIKDKQVEVQEVNGLLQLTGACRIAWKGSSAATLRMSADVCLAESDTAIGGDAIAAKVYVDGVEVPEGVPIQRQMAPNTEIFLSFESALYEPEYTASVIFKAEQTSSNAN